MNSEEPAPEKRWSRLAERILRKAGWYPGRVDKLEYQKMLLEGDMDAPEAALAFLREFGGLDLRVPIVRLLGLPIGRWVVELGCHEPVKKGGYGLLPDDYADLKQLIGPCGLVSQFPEGFNVCVVSEEGVMYDVGIDYPGGVQEVTPVGWSAREALENLCNAKLTSRDMIAFGKSSRKKLREIKQARQGQG